MSTRPGKPNGRYCVVNGSGKREDTGEFVAPQYGQSLGPEPALPFARRKTEPPEGPLSTKKRTPLPPQEVAREMAQIMTLENSLLAIFRGERQPPEEDASTFSVLTPEEKQRIMNGLTAAREKAKKSGAECRSPKQEFASQAPPEVVGFILRNYLEEEKPRDANDSKGH